MKYYAGIGSRETPEDVCVLFNKIGRFLATHGYCLRSGHAKGADISFENGCDTKNGLKEIWIPWANFEGSISPNIVTSEIAFKIAEETHPAWDRLSQGARKLHARNVHQILGIDLKTPVDFVICWTKGGKGSGGTGQAIRIAKRYNIKIYDVGEQNQLNELREFLNNMQ